MNASFAVDNPARAEATAGQVSMPFIAHETDPLLNMPPIGSSDQACKECRRRKGRCNKALPTHLTEVEERLERAEALVRQLRTMIPSDMRSTERRPSPAETQMEQSDQSFNFSSTPLHKPTGSAESEQGAGDREAKEQLHDRPSSMRQTVTTDAPEDDGGNLPQDHDAQRMLESPPLYDFEWCEQDVVNIQGLSPEAVVEGNEEDSPLSDGMASLTVHEHEGGYLGIASGAAMLRLLEPKARRRTQSRTHPAMATLAHPMMCQPNPNRHITEAMIDAYFRLYHISYPIIHEPTFRAQYSEVIPRPNGPCWTVLAYIVASIGTWASSSDSATMLDLALFSQARSILNFDFLEVGNLTLVQALTLASNYQQKRDKPNSGYTYLGIAVRMAMGLGLHKEFHGWNISPLTMEIRRRVWWSLCVFDVGATLTFSRPDVWPYKGVDVSLPLNVNDKDLTAASQTYPAETEQITPYTAVAIQARFHIAAHECYDKIISRPFPAAHELLRLDAKHIEPWQASVPPYFSENATVPPRYALSQAVMSWRLRNLRIIMYRPFVIRRALRRRADADEASTKAVDRCLADAKSTIQMIADYWGRHEHNRLAAWYALYFLFQAALIPCICLRNDPGAAEAADWRFQIVTTLHAITALAKINPSSERCHQIILDLCGRYLDYPQPERGTVPSGVTVTEELEVIQDSPGAQFPSRVERRPVGESPQTQIHNVMNMMWPNVPPMEAADVVMGDEAGWMEFLAAGPANMWDMPNP
ncbi:hypothetical protein S7711_08461 [Stachybotrys chartarum IBT 7711]|uniref:Xylanolytic transcriptional activator regulatory domain-containing protein n=1 Tax=Stachybotrys chartarum (strain CBS 109288 / IBT 7711) TaxID=1280523 RepID=A0A084AGH2_STACB|nr:hypothetical protein S7711_08461 [Stachybotrys chartarum IBT 7711]KFA52691.1 hypothetical protein S40293_08765 [Stachybotrys chartarum IBT 40293]